MNFKNAELVKNKNGGFLLTDRYYRRYFSGLDVAEGTVLLTSDATVYFADSRYFYAVKEKLAGTGVSVVCYKGLQSIAEEVKRLKIKRIFLDYEHTTLTEYDEYKKLRVKFSDGTECLRTVRSVKTQEELLFIEKACKITQKAFSEIKRYIVKGVTELQIKSKLEDLFVEFGGEGIAFDTIVAFGKNSAVPHHETGNTVLDYGMAVLIDAGCTVNGYCSDITRTFFFGNPDEKFIKAYSAVLKANEFAEENIKTDTTLKQAFGYAVGVLKDYGFAEYFTHSLGHGLGLEIHESPILSDKREGTLTENTVFTVEPGVYFDGEFGVRIEDTAVIKNGKTQRLFTDSKELVVLGI